MGHLRFCWTHSSTLVKMRRCADATFWLEQVTTGHWTQGVVSVRGTSQAGSCWFLVRRKVERSWCTGVRQEIMVSCSCLVITSSLSGNAASINGSSCGAQNACQDIGKLGRWLEAADWLLNADIWAPSALLSMVKYMMPLGSLFPLSFLSNARLTDAQS